jgi:hypothetical protein
MATNLSPELLALLQQQDAATYNKNNLGPLLQGGTYYQPVYAGGGGGGEGGFDNPGTLAGYHGYDQSWGDGGDHWGEKGQFFNADGSFSNEFDWSKDTGQNLALFLAAAGGLAFLPGGMASTLSGAPAAGTVAGDAFMPSALGAGGSEVAYGSLIPGLESYALPAAAGGAGGAVAGDAFMPGAIGTGGAPVAQGGLLPGLEGYALPASAGGSGLLSGLKSMVPAGTSSMLGPAATLLGAAAGGQGQEASASTTRELPEYLRGPVANDLIPRTQGVLNSQLPQAQTAGNQMLSVGSGLLGQTAPTTATNPYSTGIMDDMQRRYGELIDQRLQGIRGNAIGVGGLGGSRQAIAESQAISQGADNFAGQGFNFMGGLYNQDQNRLLQQQTLGAGLMGQGLDTQFAPLKNTAGVYSPFAGNGTTTQNTQQGGGWQGALGGALSGAALGKQMGWWG